MHFGPWIYLLIFSFSIAGAYESILSFMLDRHCSFWKNDRMNAFYLFFVCIKCDKIDANGQKILFNSKLQNVETKSMNEKRYEIIKYGFIHLKKSLSVKTVHYYTSIWYVCVCVCALNSPLSMAHASLYYITVPEWKIKKK